MFTNPLPRLLGLLVALTLLATGCYSLDSNITVNEDGSGTYAVEYLIDKDTTPASLIIGNDLVTPCDSIYTLRNLAPEGSVFTELNGNDQCGGRIEMTFANAEEMAAGLTDISGLARFSAFGYFPEVKVVETDGNWKMEAQFKAPVPDALGSQAEFRQEVGAGEFNFVVKLPGRQTNHNADRIDLDGSMIWEINPVVDGNRVLFLDTEPGQTIAGSDGSSGFRNGLIAAAMVLAAIGAVVMIIGNIRRRRQFEGDSRGDANVQINERLFGTSRKPKGADALESADDGEPDMTVSDAAEKSRTSLFGSPAAAGQGISETASLGDPAPVAAADSAGTGLFSGDESQQVPMAKPSRSLPVLNPEHLPAAPPPAMVPIDLAPTGSAFASAPTNLAGFEPGSETPSLAPAGFETPAFETPAFETPAFETPAFETPAFETPAFDTPAPAASVSDDWPPVESQATASTPTAPAGGVAPTAPAPAAVATMTTPGWPVAQPEATPVPTTNGPTAWPASAAEDPAPVSSLAPPPAAPRSSQPIASPVPVEAAAPTQPATAVPAPVAPATPAPTTADLTWDPERKAYVVFDPRRHAWMVFDDVARTWSEIPT